MDRPSQLKGASIDLGIEPAFDLGAGRVDPKALQYAVHGEVFRLQPQTLKVLVALHDKSGQVVTRDELIDRCWDGRVVGEDVINRCISLLRPIGSSSGCFSIETVPRSGYRLIENTTSPKPLRRYWQIAGVVLLVVAAAGAALFVTRHHATNNHRALIVSVMPFAAQPGDNRAGRLASEVQDSVVRMLAESGLSVKTPINGSQAQSDADLIVSGTVSANSQGAAAAVRLEDLRRQVIVLSRRFESDPAQEADLPDRVGANLASALSWTGPLILLDEQHPSDPAFLTQLLDEPSNPDLDGLAAFEFAWRNAPNAPNSVVAQFLLAADTGFALADIPQEQRAGAVATALEAEQRAQQLAPAFGDFYIPWCMIHSPTLMRACEDRLRTGLDRDPQAPYVAFFLSQLMNNVGRTEDAESLANASLAQDRYVSYKLGLVITLDEAGDRSDVDRVYKEAVRLWPNDSLFFWRRAEGLLQRGDLRTLARFEREVGKQNFPKDYSSAEAISDALEAHSLQKLSVACPRAAQGIQAIQCMIGSSLMGDVDDAFVFAATLYPRFSARTPAQADAIWLKSPFEQDTVYLTSPATALMRRDRRFLALADGVGLLAYWRGGRMPDFCTRSHEPECAGIAGR